MGKTSTSGFHEEVPATIESLTEEKNNLLKIISHDIRSPFSQMFALLQMFELEFDDVTESQREYINRMYRAVLGGMEMIKNLHDARSLDNGNILLSPEQVQLKSAIRTSIRNFSTQSRIKGSQISYDESGPDATVMTDKILLGKVLDIAISNALKYSESGTNVIVSYTREGEKNIITIKDQGPGLSADELKLIFNKYQKLTPKPTLGEATTGLGMHLAKEFMKMMRGEIAVENNPQGGLVVRIIL